MDHVYTLPYGKQDLRIFIDEKYHPDLILPPSLASTHDQTDAINYAIRNPLKLFKFPGNIDSTTTVVITINDKTRPVPNNILFPPLLDFLQENGVRKKNITILIATGTHLPMEESEFHLILNSNSYQGIKLISHDCDKQSGLIYKGITSRGTPVYANSSFDSADIKIVVGNIEPHHFAGFSGGAKSAAIGVCGRETINKNHSLLLDPRSCVGHYENNPLRQDIEEIGQILGINCALNVILNDKKEILHAFFGLPIDVMEAGIQIIRDNELIHVNEPYDLVIASAGGYPKDINLYQAQKALTHASLFCKDGGTVLLAVACEEGVGSQSYDDFMNGVKTYAEARKKFIQEGFKVGPHKAFQFASISERIKFQVMSDIQPSTMKRLLIEQTTDIQKSVNNFLSGSPYPPRIAILPHATATIPLQNGAFNEK